MKTRIFIDTSAFVALYDKKDQCHHRASSFLQDLDLSAAELHTSNYIIDETIQQAFTFDDDFAKVGFTIANPL